MKNLIMSAFAALALLFSCNQSSPKVNPPSLVGTWEYTGDVGGMAILQEKDFIFFATFKPDSAFSDSLTTNEILDRYNTMNIVAGTHSIGDSLVTCATKFHKDPNEVGKDWKWSYTISGDDLHWKAMDENGNVLGEGTARRITN